MTGKQRGHSIGRFPGLSLAELQGDPATTVLELATPLRDYDPVAIAFVLGCYATLGHNRRDDVEAVAGELVANAVYHGNDRDPSKTIGLYCLWRRCFYLAVQDQGPGFKIADPPFVPGKSGMPPEGGAGLGVVKEKADLVYADGSAVVAVFGAE